MKKAEFGDGVHDLTSGEGRRVSEDDVVSATPWMPDSRRLLYYTRDAQRVLLDVETGERRVIPVDLPVPVGEASLAVAPGGTAIYFGAEQVESNIWMVERGR